MGVETLVRCVLQPKRGPHTKFQKLRQGVSSRAWSSRNPSTATRNDLTTNRESLVRKIDFRDMFQTTNLQIFCPSKILALFSGIISCHLSLDGIQKNVM